MKIYTGSFPLIKYMPMDMIKINISNWPPKWASFLNYRKLYPPVDLLVAYREKTITDEEYTKTYNAVVLEHLRFHEVLMELKELSNDKDIILLCHESADKFCHRQLVAKWFTDNGIEVVEWEREKK